MSNLPRRGIACFFYLLFFLVPLIFYTKTSELFEFNKIVLTYAITIFIVALWIAQMIIEKKIIFRRTILDWPLLIFLLSQLLSTIFSIDQRTSLLGYYSRFNGGLLSTMAYALLYWAYVSNMDKKSTLCTVYTIMLSTAISSIWAIFEHFGKSPSCVYVTYLEGGTGNPLQYFNTDCWVQDVQTRVFSTFGQPNWLAAWLVAVTPLTWLLALKSNVRIKLQKTWLWFLLSVIFFTALLFTKSRSGMLGFLVASILFWLPTGWQWIKNPNLNPSGFFRVLLIFNIAFLILATVFGTPWTNSILERNNQSSPAQSDNQQSTTNSTPSATSLETGGTDSGKIRLIVWRGAIAAWRAKPIFGHGVETFAFLYPNFRPVEHNLVSEWEFIYNKAHNEYLNYLATTGIVGLLAYSTVVFFALLQIYKIFASSIHQITKSAKRTENYGAWSIGILAGYTGILVTNFFGFSVVTTSLLFFLFPAMAVTVNSKQQAASRSVLNSIQVIILISLLFTTYFSLLTTYNYWQTDILYNTAKKMYLSGEYETSRKILEEVVMRSPKQAAYWDQLALTSSRLAAEFHENGDDIKAREFGGSAIFESSKALGLSPYNVPVKKNAANIFIRLSALDSNHLVRAREMMKEATYIAPTDPKLHYNLAVAYLRTGDMDNSIKTLEKTILMKPNYKDARFALALIYIDGNELDKAREQLKYILENIDPSDIDTQRELAEIGK